MCNNRTLCLSWKLYYFYIHRPFSKFATFVISTFHEMFLKLYTFVYLFFQLFILSSKRWKIVFRSELKKWDWNLKIWMKGRFFLIKTKTVNGGDGMVYRKRVCTPTVLWAQFDVEFHEWHRASFSGCFSKRTSALLKQMVQMRFWNDIMTQVKGYKFVGRIICTALVRITRERKLCNRDS